MKVHIQHTREEMGKVAGKMIEDKIIELLAQQDAIRMIFAAAPSQNEVLAYLAQSEQIEWPRITAFHMDEYIGLPDDAPQKFSNFLKERLFDKVPFKAVHLLQGGEPAEDECEIYSQLLSEKPIDIVCLGIGENGHIAFNDPPVADFDDPEMVKVVELDEMCRQQQVNDGCFGNIDEVPTHALTLTVPTLMSGKFLFCVVPGPTKQLAVTKTLNDEISTACPATILRTHTHCHLFLDEASAPK